jgi:hypothetical protein
MRASNIGVALALLLTAAAVPSAAQGLEKASPAPAPEVVAAAAEVQTVGPKVARLWRGYWPPQQAFIIYKPGEGALLISGEAGPPSFVALDRNGLPKALRGRAWFRPGTLEDARRPFMFDYPIGGGRTAILVFADGRSGDLPSLIFHEQFHQHQRTAFEGPGAFDFVAPDAVPDRASFAASAETERRVLAAALTARPGKAREKLLHSYFALRREREAALGADVLKVERGLERIEGTAEFVERAAAAYAAGSEKRLPALLSDSLREGLGAGGEPFALTWFRSRSYSVGAALTYFLRALDPKGWQRTIESGTPLDQRLAALLRFDRVPAPAALASEARAAFGYDAIRSDLAPKIEAAAQKEIKSVEEFYALGAYRLVFEAKGAVLGFTTGPGRMVQISQTQLVLPDPRFVSMKHPHALLTATERPFLSETGEIGRYTALLPSVPTVNGLASLAPGEHRFDKVEVIGDGLKLTVERPVIVTVSEGAMAIRLAETDPARS